MPRSAQRDLTHRSSSRSTPDAIESRLFPRRSGRRSSAYAPHGWFGAFFRKAAPEEPDNLRLSCSTAVTRPPSFLASLPRSCSQGLQPTQLEMVWRLPPQGDAEGPQNPHLLHSTASSIVRLCDLTLRAHGALKSQVKSSGSSVGAPSDREQCWSRRITDQ